MNNLIRRDVSLPTNIRFFLRILDNILQADSPKLFFFLLSDFERNAFGKHRVREQDMAPLVDLQTRVVFY